MHGAVGDLAQKNRQELARLVDRSHEGLDQAVELAVRRELFGGDDLQPVGDGGVPVTDDGRVELALAREVVIDHRLVHAGAAGDAIDAGRGEPARGELVGRGSEDAAAGGGRGPKFGGHGMSLS